MGRKERLEAWQPPVDTTPVNCQMCEQQRYLTFHHLIPVTCHDNKWFKKNFTKDQMDSGIYVCRLCHDAIHRLIPDEKELGRTFNTLEKILAVEKIQKFIVFSKKQK
jgi:hypothetical protein